MSSYLKAVIGKLDPASRTALDAAIIHTASLYHTDITPEHLFLALISLESTLMSTLEVRCGLQTGRLSDALHKALETVSVTHAATPVLAPELVKWLTDSWLLASTTRDQPQFSPAALIATLINDHHDALLTPSVRPALHCTAIASRPGNCSRRKRPFLTIIQTTTP